jgi:exportin-T
MLLDVLLQKMKWDGDEDPDDLDEDDRAAFEELRKVGHDLVRQRCAL